MRFCWDGSMKPGHLLSLLDLDRSAFDSLMAESARWKAGKGKPLGGELRRVATIFDGPAFRTRLAFDAALSNLGVHQVALAVHLGEREPVRDTAAILNGAVDAVVVRTSDHAAVTELALHSEIPVVNAMTATGHPCEVISEAFTILARRGELDGLRLTFVGEDTNLCRSWCELTTIFDLTVTQVCPPGWELPATFLDSLKQHGQQGQVAVAHDLEEGTAGADVIYTDGWPPATREPGPDREAFRAIQITRTTLDRAGPATLLMHCMPVRRGDEVTAEAFDDHRSITLKAKANLGPTHTAIVNHVLGC
jgi:ornithine carbamoyltransferase